MGSLLLFPFWSVKFASWINKRRKLSLHKDGAEAHINCSLKSNGWKDPPSVSWLCKRFAYIWNIVKSSQIRQKVFEKKVYSEEGYATSLGCGDILPMILQNDVNADKFYLVRGKKLAGLIQLLHLTAFLKFYLLV